MNYRTFGKTGLTVSELGFGGIPILRLETEQAVVILKHAYDMGITFYDTANAYKDSEEKMGIAFSGMRDKVVLATKTLKRDAAGAMEHLETSLRRMKTDYIDLYQLHQVADDEAFDAIMAPDGAYDAVVKAKKAGKVRHIGVSSHNLQMAIKLVKYGLFETIQFPFNFIETEPADEMNVIAAERGMGVIAMKPFAGGVIDNGPLAFKFLRQHPDVLPIPGCDSIASVDAVVSYYDGPNVVTDQDLELMEKYRGELGKRFCRRCEYCQPCPNGVTITLCMGYRILVSRMSQAVGVQWAGSAMESITECTECGECVARCPYDLPIPEILKDNYALYKSHRDGLKNP